MKLIFNQLFELMCMQHRAHNFYGFIILIESDHGCETFFRSRADLGEKCRHLEELNFNYYMCIVNPTNYLL